MLSPLKNIERRKHRKLIKMVGRSSEARDIVAKYETNLMDGLRFSS